MTTSNDAQVIWDRFAEGYDTAITPISTKLAERALDAIGLRPGMTFLDVAAGGGALCLPAARRGARVTATDISPVMVDRLAQHARTMGMAGVEARVMDGMALDLPDDSFDVSGSQLGIMLFPDRARGLRELVRVTKPGGTMLMVVFGAPEKVEFISLFVGALRSVAPDVTLPPGFPLFSLQDPETLRQEMTAAGASTVRVEAVDETVELRTAAEYWTTLTSGAPPIAAIAAGLSEEQRQGAMRALDDLLAARLQNGVARLNVRANIGIGTK